MYIRVSRILSGAPDFVTSPPWRKEVVAIAKFNAKKMVISEIKGVSES